MRTVKGRENSLNILIPVAIVAFAIAIRFWLQGYWQGFGERDTYRVANGVIDAINHRSALSDSLIYGNQASPMYIRMLTLLRPLATDPLNFAVGMNALAAIFATLSLIPMAVIAGRAGGRLAAASVVIATATIPLWWKVSGYAHPTWPAICFFVAAAAFAMAIEGWRRRDLWLYAAVLLCLTCSFGSRIDNVVMAPMLLGAVWQDGRIRWDRAAALTLAGLLAVVLSRLLFGLGETVGQVDHGELLLQWFHPARYAHYVKDSLFRFVIATNPAIVAGAATSVAIALHNRSYRLLLATLPLIALDFVFWIPNGERERHFLGVIAGVGILVGYGVGAGASLLPNGQRIWGISSAAAAILLLVAAATRSDTALYLSALPAVVPALAGAAFLLLRNKEYQALAAAALILTPVALHVLVRHRFYENQYRPDIEIVTERKVDAILSAAKSGPIYVITDAAPLTAHIQRRTPLVDISQTPIVVSPTDPSKSDQWVQVALPTGTVKLYDQGWNEPEALRALLQQTQGRRATVLIDREVAPKLAASNLDKLNLQKQVFGGNDAR